MTRSLALFLFLGLFPFLASASEGAKFVSQVVPDEVAAGQRFAVVVQYRNEGKRSWGPGLRLRQVGSRVWGRVNGRAMEKRVAPGETASFRITLTAPRRTGRYRLRWRLSEGGRLFGPASPVIQVTVNAAPQQPRWAAEFVHQRLPGLTEGDPPFALLQTGRAYPVTLMFKNIGSRTWRGGEVKLVPVGSSSSGLWSVAALPLPERVEVVPGAFHAFHFTVLAPLQPGIYPFQWQLEHRGRPFGETSPKVMVTVR